VKLAIMQPYLFPYLGYFQLLAAVDRFVCYDDVAFIRQGWINRNRLLINGQAAYFTVPVRQASSFRLISETDVDDGRATAQWRHTILKTFDNAYRRAPEFSSVFPLIEEVISPTIPRVADVARASIDVVCRFLNISTPRVPSSTIYQNRALDGQDRVIAICRAEGAHEYVNAIGGLKLYTREAFGDAGITLRFLESLPVEYRQFGAAFVPDLSIVDALMFNSRDVVRGFLGRCRLT
jgi:hypothetical protein